MKEELTKIRDIAISLIDSTSNTNDLEEIRVKYLGRKGELTKILRSLGNIAPEERGEIGKLSNKYKIEIENSINDKKKEIIKDSVICEYALTIFVNEIEIATLMCTPEFLEELTIGYLWMEIQD